MTTPAERIGVVLIGHGSPATDCPPELVGELMGLEWRQARAGDGEREVVERRAADLDARIRNWPRHASNDPYRHGLEQLAQALKTLLPTDLLAVGYNEFCRPTIAEAVEDVIRQGATRVLVVPSMLTPGGVHAERDIPLALEPLRRAHPDIPIQYVWPFDLGQVAAVLAAHIARAMAGV